jgi:hypothetical protein
MKRSLLPAPVLALVLALLAVAPLAPAQTNPVDAARIKKSEEVMRKLRQVDLLNQILPVAFTKEQFSKILPVIEKCRQLVRTTEQDEAKALAALEAKADQAIKDAVEKGIMPKEDYLLELRVKLAELSTQRQKVRIANTMAVTTIIMEVCNKGQQRAAGNSFNPRLVEPNLKLEELTEERRLQFWIQEVLLDPLAYDLLVQLSRRAS